MSQRCEATIHKTPHDVIVFMRSALIARAMMGVMVAAILIAIGSFLLDGKFTLSDSLPAVIMALAAASYLWVSIPNTAKNLFRDQPAQGGPIMVVADDNALSCSSTHGISTFQWSEFVMWRETKTALGLYPNRYTNMILPKRDLSPEMVAFMLRKLVESGLAKSGRLRGK